MMEKSALKMHIKSKTADINKFTIFCAVNTSIPFYIKKQVFDSCLLSSLLYGCETWFTNNLKEIEHVYIRMIKVLLGFRESTPSANCLVELGQKNLKSIVNERRKSFLMKKFSNIDIEEPLHIMVQNTNSYKMIINSMSNSVDNGLPLHPVYLKGCSVPDYQRVISTRLRLTSDNLISEKGRWSRTSPDKRVCPVSTPQDIRYQKKVYRYTSPSSRNDCKRDHET